MFATVLRRWHGSAIGGGNLVVITPGAVVPPPFVGVLPMVFLHAACVAGVVRGLPFVENVLHHVFYVSELGRNVEKFGAGPWYPAPMLMDERLVCGAIGEGAYHIDVGGIGELVSLLDASSDIVPEAFPALLDATFEVPRAPRALVGTQEIFDEGFLEASPVVDGVGRQMLEPCSCSFGQVMDGEELDDQVILPNSCHTASVVLLLLRPSGWGGTR
jgi:hypothetical protein